MGLFCSETSLVDAFSDHAADFLSDMLRSAVDRFFLLREFDSRNGIADLVLGTYRRSLPLASDGVRATVNVNWISPLMDLEPDQFMSVESLSRDCGISLRMAERRLREYARAEFLMPTGSGWYRVVRQYDWVLDTVVAIEAKLRDWRRALVQACRYRRFSDYSLVLIDAACSAPALANLDSFIENNVGLITLKIDGGWRAHHIPPKRGEKNPYYYGRVNETAYAHFVSHAAVC